MKRWFFWLTILILSFSLYGNSSQGLRHYRKYLLSLYKLGMKDLAREKLVYAFKKFGRNPALLDVEAIIEGRKPLVKKSVSSKPNLSKRKNKYLSAKRSKFNSFQKQPREKNSWSWLKKKLHTLRYYSYFLVSVGAFFVLPPL